MYTGPVLPNLQTLQQLHHRHLLTIPFENLSNIKNEGYANTKDQLFKKIIEGQRGGLCYELNALFGFLSHKGFIFNFPLLRSDQSG